MLFHTITVGSLNKSAVISLTQQQLTLLEIFAFQTNLIHQQLQTLINISKFQSHRLKPVW